MARTKKPSSAGVGAQPLPGPQPHSDSVSAREAEDALRSSDAATQGPVVVTNDGEGEDAPSGTVKIGNREFVASRKKLGGKNLDILPDLPDIRDRIYEPSLRALPSSIYPLIAFPVRNQGAAQSCTGHALAHVIDCLLFRGVLAGSPPRVSAQMLYEMAKRNDEWAGTTYSGSSARGAVSGFFRNGVCSEALAPDVPDDAKDNWVLTYGMAKEARETRLGAYYRLQPDLSDYHAALAETGAIYATAQIHANWEHPVDGEIEPGGLPAGGHAFAIVGYDADGFWVLNSWGAEWGKGGIAHWRYEDWAATMMDGWVLQLGVRAPAAFSAIPRAVPAGIATPKVAAPNRGDILGHFINIDDGRYETGGRYGSPTLPEMTETVKRLADPASNESKGYDHLVIYAHGGLNTLNDEANRIAAWKRNDIFGRNRIYNFHLMWGSGFVDEAFGPLSDTPAGRASGLIGDLVFETGVGKALGSRAWRNMKQDAKAAFTESAEFGGGLVGLAPLLAGVDKAAKRQTLHLVGHSAGSIMLGELLRALHDDDYFKLKNLELGSIHLMAPACTVAFFIDTYKPYLDGKGALALKDKLYLYNMSDQLELKDTVGVSNLPGYSRSLLYLVSRAYEEAANTPLAGMQSFVGGMPRSGKLSIDYAKSDATASTSHGGFDNDVATLSTIMSRVLGSKVPHPPSANELTGY